MRLSALLLLVGVVFVAGLGLLLWRDHQAAERCRNIGGQTWDSGEHCVIGGKIRNTR